MPKTSAKIAAKAWDGIGFGAVKSVSMFNKVAPNLSDLYIKVADKVERKHFQQNINRNTHA